MRKQLPPANQFLFILALSALIAACGGGTKNDVSSAEDSTHEKHGAAKKQDGMAVEGLLGSIPMDEVERVFDNNMQRLVSCYQDAMDDAEEIEGNVQVSLQIDPSGNVTQAHISRSDLGALESEKCITRAIRRFRFRREGEGIAHVTKEIALEAPYEHPKESTWEDEIIKEILDLNKETVQACLHGQDGVLLTLYVGRGGVVLSAGASAQEYEAVEAGHCLAKAARDWAFPDPGSEIVKLSTPF